MTPRIGTGFRPSKSPFCRHSTTGYCRIHSEDALNSFERFFLRLLRAEMNDRRPCYGANNFSLTFSTRKKRYSSKIVTKHRKKTESRWEKWLERRRELETNSFGRSCLASKHFNIFLCSAISLREISPRSPKTKSEENDKSPKILVKINTFMAFLLIKIKSPAVVKAQIKPFQSDRSHRRTSERVTSSPPVINEP